MVEGVLEGKGFLEGEEKGEAGVKEGGCFRVSHGLLLNACIDEK